VTLSYALSQAQRQLRDVVCQRRTTRAGRLNLLDWLSRREPHVKADDVEVVRRWLIEVHSPRRSTSTARPSAGIRRRSRPRRERRSGLANVPPHQRADDRGAVGVVGLGDLAEAPPQFDG
jgi:hypothetical protein